MDKDDFQKLSAILTESLGGIAATIAERHAQDMVARVLKLEDYDLRNRIDDQIRKVVAERVEEHLDISVRWK